MTIRDKWRQFWNWVEENSTKPDDPNYYLQSPEPSNEDTDPWTAGETKEVMKFQTDESLKTFTYLAARWWDRRLVGGGLKPSLSREPWGDSFVLATGLAALLVVGALVVSVIKKLL